MRIQVTSPPTSLSTGVGKGMVGIVFTDAHDRIWPGTFFVPVANVLMRMPAFEECPEFSHFMEGIYLPKEACAVL